MFGRREKEPDDQIRDRYCRDTITTFFSTLIGGGCVTAAVAAPNLTQGQKTGLMFGALLILYGMVKSVALGVHASQMEVTLRKSSEPTPPEADPKTPISPAPAPTG
jgi:hypothetical protein